MSRNVVGRTSVAAETFGLQRALITPEGIDLRLSLATSSQRATAFLLDALIIIGVLTALTLMSLGAVLAIAAVFGSLDGQAWEWFVEWIGAIWLLGFFLMRIFYFVGFEMGARAATPGKRLVGLRVAMRGGGPLTADAIFTRNAMREIEVICP